LTNVCQGLLLSLSACFARATFAFSRFPSRESIANDSHSMAGVLLPWSIQRQWLVCAFDLTDV
jgi:hypothetical protein